MRALFRFTILTTVLLTGCLDTGLVSSPSGAPGSAPALAAQASTDPPAIHGMLLFGDRQLYASHLPMFHAPHDYQAIMAIHLSSPSGDPAALYRADRARTDSSVYTVLPEPFVLPDVVGERRPFKATIYRGDFEKGGTPIANDVTVSIDSVVVFRKLDPVAARPSQAEDLLFGTGDQAYLAHWIVAPPDFDQIVAIRPQQPLPNRPTVVRIAGQPDDRPLREGQSISATTPDATLHMAVTSDLWEDSEDLSM